MNGLFEVLQKIEQQPGMYLGRPSVSDLFMFLVGYEFARSQMGVELAPEEVAFYEEFQPWLQRRLGVRSVTGVANELVELGIPKQEIVLGFQAPYKRPYTEFAVQ